MFFIGHQKIIKLLDKNLNKGKVAQAYLFSGPESVGKFTLAKLYAESLIKGTADILQNMKAQKESSGVLDLIIIEPEKEEKRGIIKEKNIKIEQIRAAQNDMLLFPYSGKYKVLIINNAQQMTISAQNSLLKTLEEPNSTSVIILVTHEPLRILPTLRSRCQNILFSLLSNEEIFHGLKDISDKLANEIISLSLGRPGVALELKNKKDEFVFRQEALLDLKHLSSMSLNSKFDLAEKLSKNIQETTRRMELWIWAIRLEMLKDGLPQKNIGAGYQQIEMIEKSLLTLQQTNASGRLVLENLLMNL
jgi:DNA polymerase III subunit delta'